MPGRLANKTAIITGATSGIGKATARVFSAAGASLLITGRRLDLGVALAAELDSPSVRCIYVEADHTRIEDCQRVVDAAVGELGRIDILFNNAGIVTSGTAETTTDEVWEQTLAINVTAVWHMCRLVIPHMKRQGGGAIVNNGSDWSVVADRDAFPYIVSKGAVAMLTKAAAMDFAADNIRINAVCPGDTLVERWLESGYFEGSDPVTREQAMKESASYLPLGRFAQPEEIARAVLFLASDDSSFVTGHLLLVDGGNTAH
jgi:NAD(P)-dependent dehydrogenase (short-subunit alcohol dehydrogenase family)